MKYFLKLNVMSIVYAVMIVVPIELIVNVYRISRITDLTIDKVTISIGIDIVLGFIFGTITFL